MCASAPTGRRALGCVEGLEPLALESDIIDGKALPVIEEPG
jgi:hypothetical protein